MRAGAKHRASERRLKVRPWPARACQHSMNESHRRQACKKKNESDRQCCTDSIHLGFDFDRASSLRYDTPLRDLYAPLGRLAGDDRCLHSWERRNAFEKALTDC